MGRQIRYVRFARLKRRAPLTEPLGRHIHLAKELPVRRTRLIAAGTGRRRATADRGFTPVQVVGAIAGVSVLAVAGVGWAVSSMQGPGEEPATVRVIENVSAANKVKSDPASPAAGAADEKPAAKAKAKDKAKAPSNTASQAPAAPRCSTSTGKVALKVDALVHALGAKNGTVRSEAAEADIVARPATGNACTSAVKLFMGENWAFEGTLPYGDWILDIDVLQDTTKVPVTVDSRSITMPTQVVNGDCGGTSKVTVRALSGGALVKASPLDASVTATRVPDESCIVPAQSTFTTGADGVFKGTIGHGDWMFTALTPSGPVSQFVTVNDDTDEIVLEATGGLLGL
jgi:hypothetical protein